MRGIVAAGLLVASAPAWGQAAIPPTARPPAAARISAGPPAPVERDNAAPWLAGAALLVLAGGALWARRRR